MNFKIIGDSCCDFTQEDLKKEYVACIPLTIVADDKEISDDDNVTQSGIFEYIEACREGVKSACPSPQTYMDSYEAAKDIYVITISSKLSGTYVSADIAKDLFLEDHPGARIHVFDSKTASAGQYIIFKKIEELALSGYGFSDIVNMVTEYINSLNTIFVLEDLTNMIKNGRIKKLKGAAANMLNIKPVLCGKDGEIAMIDQGRGMNKALNKMLHHIDKTESDRKFAVISYCDCPARAKNVKKVLVETMQFEKVKIIQTKGISTVYANRGGVIVAF